MHKAVFLDRDGTIIEDVGYLRSPQDIKFLPGAIAAIKKLNQAGYKVVVITNQAGVARGFLSEDMLQTIDKTLHKHILSGGAHLDALYYCPHHPDYGYYPYRQDCHCRKPQPGLLQRAAQELQINLKESFMIGDKNSDIEAGRRAGTKTVFVKSGQHRESDLQTSPDFIAPNLAAAVDWLLQQGTSLDSST